MSKNSSIFKGLVEDIAKEVRKYLPKSKQMAAALTEIGNEISTEAKLNIRNMPVKSKFGEHTGLFWRGGLLNSINYRVVSTDKKTAVLEVGSFGVIYARIHELGTVGAGGALPDIVPKRAKALTIPAQRKYRGKFARDFPRGTLIKISKAGKRKNDPTGILVDRMRLEKLTMHKETSRIPKEAIAYYLRKRSRIPPRPYLYPAFMAKEKWMLERLKWL